MEQNIIVFGATGRIGALVSKQLAQAGYGVVIHYFQNREKAERIVSEITEAGGSAVALHADVRDLAQTEELAEQAVRRFGTIHAAVNFVFNDRNYKSVPVENMDWEDWNDALDSVHSHFNICKALIPRMKRQQYGRILYISGGLAYRFYTGCSVFSTVKAGLNAFCKTLAKEVGPDHITVNVIAPGKVAESNQKDADSLEDDVNQCALGRFACAADIAGAIEFFASDKAAFITGQTLYVSGGEIMPMP